MRNPPVGYEPLDRAALTSPSNRRVACVAKLFQIFGMVWMQAAQKPQEVCHGF
jgi:hypothetical protein